MWRGKGRITVRAHSSGLEVDRGRWAYFEGLVGWEWIGIWRKGTKGIFARFLGVRIRVCFTYCKAKAYMATY